MISAGVMFLITVIYQACVAADDGPAASQWTHGIGWGALGNWVSVIFQVGCNMNRPADWA